MTKQEIEFFIAQCEAFEVGEVSDEGIADVILCLPRAIDPTRFLPGRLALALLRTRLELEPFLAARREREMDL